MHTHSFENSFLSICAKIDRQAIAVTSRRLLLYNHAIVAVLTVAAACTTTTTTQLRGYARRACTAALSSVVQPRRRDTSAMADVPVNHGITRRMSFGFNGKINGVEEKTPFLIGVSGGTASGKSTVCKRIMEKLGQVEKNHTERQVVCISQDSFYRDLTPTEKLKAEKGQFNFDHPDAFNNDLILQTLQDILAGKKCEIPAYDYRTNSLIKDQITTIYPADVVLFEGILVFYFPKIRELFHMKLFVDTDSDTRLARRVPRDINERGRDLDYVLNQYMNFVKPAFEEFCLPTKKFADVIIPRGADNTVAIDLIVHHIWDILHSKNGDSSSGQHPYIEHNRRTSTSSSDALSR